MKTYIKSSSQSFVNDIFQSIIYAIQNDWSTRHYVSELGRYCHTVMGVFCVIVHSYWYKGTLVNTCDFILKVY